MSATAWLWAIADRGLVLAPPTWSVLGTPVLQAGGKCQHHSSDQGAPTLRGLRQDEEEAANIGNVPKEWPHRKCKEGKALKEPQREDFSKESNIVKVARQAYQMTHQAIFEQDGSYDLSSIFCQMAISTNLLRTEIYDVQETWGGQKDLTAATQVAKPSPKDIHFFQVILPTDLLKIMGLKGIPFLQGLWWQGGLTFCP